MQTRPQRRSNDHTDSVGHAANEPLSFDEWHHVLPAVDDTAPSIATQHQPPPPFHSHFDTPAAPSIHMLFVDPTLLPPSDLPTYHVPTQLPPLSWVDQTRTANDSYVSMMLQPPPPPPPQRAPPRQLNTPGPRRSARIAAAPRVEDMDAEESQSSSVSVMDDQTSDEDRDGNVQPEDMRERRRAQVREASSRRRQKLKTEVEFIANRSREQQEHMDILNRMFPTQ